MFSESAFYWCAEKIGNLAVILSWAAVAVCERENLILNGALSRGAGLGIITSRKSCFLDSFEIAAFHGLQRG